MKRRVLLVAVMLMTMLLLSGCASVVNLLNTSARFLETTERTIVETENSIREVKNSVKSVERICSENSRQKSGN